MWHFFALCVRHKTRGNSPENNNKQTEWIPFGVHAANIILGGFRFVTRSHNPFVIITYQQLPTYSIAEKATKKSVGTSVPWQKPHVSGNPIPSNTNDLLLLHIISHLPTYLLLSVNCFPTDDIFSTKHTNNTHFFLLGGEVFFLFFFELPDIVCRFRLLSVRFLHQTIGLLWHGNRFYSLNAAAVTLHISGSKAVLFVKNSIITDFII